MDVRELIQKSCKNTFPPQRDILSGLRGSIVLKNSIDAWKLDTSVPIFPNLKLIHVGMSLNGVQFETDVYISFRAGTRASYSPQQASFHVTPKVLSQWSEWETMTKRGEAHSGKFPMLLCAPPHILPTYLPYPPNYPTCPSYRITTQFDAESARCAHVKWKTA